VWRRVEEFVMLVWCAFEEAWCFFEGDGEGLGLVKVLLVSCCRTVITYLSVCVCVCVCSCVCICVYVFVSVYMLVCVV